MWLHEPMTHLQPTPSPRPPPGPRPRGGPRDVPRLRQHRVLRRRRADRAPRDRRGRDRLVHDARPRRTSRPSASQAARDEAGLAGVASGPPVRRCAAVWDAEVEHRIPDQRALDTVNAVLREAPRDRARRGRRLLRHRAPPHGRRPDRRGAGGRRPAARRRRSPRARPDASGSARTTAVGGCSRTRRARPAPLVRHGTVREPGEGRTIPVEAPAPQACGGPGRARRSAEA